MHVVLDTNVLVSGLLNEFGNPGKIIDLILTNLIIVAYDDRILSEYDDVLARQEFNFDPDLARTILNAIEINGLYVDAKIAPESLVSDPGDVPCIEVALSSPIIDCLITGNLRHFSRLQASGLVKIYSPAESINQYFS